MNKLIVYTDGASKGNPGPGFAMFVIGSIRKRVKLDHCTNNEAEYKAVIYALDELIQNPALWQTRKAIEFKIDSKLVVEQLNGRFKVKNAKIREYISQINILLNQIPTPVFFQYIPREQNLADSLKY